MYEEEINLWMGLKFEAHLNSLIAQLVELCAQLPDKTFFEISEDLISKGSMINPIAYKQSLVQLEKQSMSVSSLEIN